MAFTTVTGSNGITSLVGTTGVDTATIVTLNDKVFVGGNTGNDTIVTALGTGSVNLSDYNVRMGGGDDGVVITNNLLNSFISLDGETLANDGNDAYSGAGATTVNSEIVGRGGNDSFALGFAEGSLFNGNSGNDEFTSAAFAGSGINLSNVTVLGGQGSDTFTIGLGANAEILGSGNNFNGNKGDDSITVEGATLASSTLFGGQGSDVLTLSTTIDGNTLSGDLGADTLNGSVSDDILLGGDDNDTMNGEAGGDTLTGGAGNNTFVYTTLTDSILTDFDTITDFVANNGTTGDFINNGNKDLTATAAGIGYQLNASDINGAGAAVTTLAAALESVFNKTDAAVDATNAYDLEKDKTATISITGGGSFNGNYIIVNGGTDGFDAVDSAVIKVNSIANITDATLI